MVHKTWPFIIQKTHYFLHYPGGLVDEPFNMKFQLGLSFNFELQS